MQLVLFFHVLNCVSETLKPSSVGERGVVLLASSVLKL